jgi:hypothetical protein
MVYILYLLHANGKYFVLDFRQRGNDIFAQAVQKGLAARHREDQAAERTLA